MFVAKVSFAIEETEKDWNVTKVGKIITTTLSTFYLLNTWFLKIWLIGDLLDPKIKFMLISDTVDLLYSVSKNLYIYLWIAPNFDTVAVKYF